MFTQILYQVLNQNCLQISMIYDNAIFAFERELFHHRNN